MRCLEAHLPHRLDEFPIIYFHVLRTASAILLVELPSERIGDLEDFASSVVLSPVLFGQYDWVWIYDRLDQGPMLVIMNGASPPLLVNRMDVWPDFFVRDRLSRDDGVIETDIGVRLNAIEFLGLDVYPRSVYPTFAGIVGIGPRTFTRCGELQLGTLRADPRPSHHARPVARSGLATGLPAFAPTSTSGTGLEVRPLEFISIPSCPWPRLSLCSASRDLSHARLIA